MSVVTECPRCGSAFNLEGDEPITVGDEYDCPACSCQLMVVSLLPKLKLEEAVVEEVASLYGQVKCPSSGVALELEEPITVGDEFECPACSRLLVVVSPFPKLKLEEAVVKDFQKAIAEQPQGLPKQHLSCPKCGAQLPGKVNFCVNCGAKILSAERSQQKGALEMNAQQIRCPIDKKDDMLQKVSSIVTSGKATGTFSGPSGGGTYTGGKWGGYAGYSVLSGSTTTQLAQLLSPPQKPTAPVNTSWTVYGGCFILGISFLIIYINAAAPTQGLEIAGFFWACGIAIFYFADRRYRNREPIEAKKMASWEQACAKWNQLYYCWKHDLVFDPSTGQSCQPADINAFLYS